MFQIQMLRALVNERLSAAVEEIFVVLERTISDYEEELCRTKEENRRQRQLLDAVFKVDADAPDKLEAGGGQGKAAEQPTHPDEANLGQLPVTCVIVKSEDEEQSESREKTAPQDANKCFQCPQCHKSYSSKGHLRRHVKSHAAGEVERLTECSASGKPLATGRSSPPAPALERSAAEERPAAEERRFSCSACDMTFKFQSTFLGHMKKHAGGKLLSCGVCGATFRFRSTLLNHSRTHTGEKPFTCQLCNASFSVHSSLLRHARLHTGEKRFVCSFCDKKFPRKASLVEHMRIHTGEKPLSCSVCRMNFRFHSKLVKHMRSHEGDEPLVCGACGQKFLSRLRLDKHACAAAQAPFHP